MAFSEQFSLSNNTTFQNAVKIAMLSAAEQVASEQVTDNPVVDGKRQTLAQTILNDGGANKLTAFVNACAALGTLTTQSTDNDIQFVVNSLWNSLAGVLPTDKLGGK